MCQPKITAPPAAPVASPEKTVRPAKGPDEPVLEIADPESGGQESEAAGRKARGVSRLKIQLSPLAPSADGSAGLQI